MKYALGWAHSAGQINSCKCHIYGARLTAICSLSFREISLLHMDRGKLIAPGYTRSLQKSIRDPSSCKLGSWPLLSQWKHRRKDGIRQYTNAWRLNIHTCFFRKTHLSWILKAVSPCRIATFPKMPFPFYRLSAHWSPGFAELQDSNGAQTRSIFLASFLIHSFLWKAQNQLVLHLHLWLCCRSLKPACGPSWSNMQQQRQFLARGCELTEDNGRFTRKVLPEW